MSRHSSGDTQANKQAEPGFFDRFGQEDPRKEKLRQEMMKDYEEFKKRDEEKFRNRFASKKAESERNGSSRPTVGAMHNGDSNGIHISGNIRKSETGPSSSIDEEFELASRLRNLEEKINALHSESQHANSTERLPPLTSGHNHGSVKKEASASSRSPKSEPDFYFRERMEEYENELRKRLLALKEADARLISIEEEYAAAKNELVAAGDQGGKSAGRELPEISERKQVLRQTNLFDRPETAKSRYRQQQAYRRELEQQIIEVQRRRKAAREAEQMGPVETAPETVVENDETHKLGNRFENISRSPAYKSPEDKDYFASGERDLLHVSPNFVVSAGIPNLDQSGTHNNNGFTRSQRAEDPQFSKKAKYAQELRRQIEEDKRKKERQKKEDEEYERKIEAECAMQNTADANKVVCSPPVSHPDEHPGQQALEQSDSTFARGGHGIFGSPLTDDQKSSLQKYKNELAQQIAERKRASELEKLREQELDRKEAERIAADQLKIQQEYEMEQQRLRKIREEANKQTEIPYAAVPWEGARSNVEKKNQPSAKTVEGPRATEKKPARVRNERKRTHPKAAKKKSPELLIGPEVRTHPVRNFNGSPGLRPATVDGRTRSIISKLQNLRSQLDLEKNKLEQALKSQHYTGNADPSSYHPITTVYARAHPRVDRRAATLFDVHKDDVFTGNDNKMLNEPVTREFHSEPAVEEWGSEALKEESFSILDEQQVAYLRAQDNYIDELREQLDILQMHDMRDDAKPERQPPIDEIEGRINELQMKSDSMFVNIQGRAGDLGEENLDTTSQVSVNVEEIDARNKQRLKRLEAMQLLNDIDLDPEMVLERFMTKNIQPVNRSGRY